MQGDSAVGATERVIKNKTMRKSYFNSVKFSQCVLHGMDVLINLLTLNNPIR